MKIEDNNLAGWEMVLKDYEPTTQPKQTLTCPSPLCGQTWTARIGKRGWNRCPHCQRIYSRQELR